MKRYFKRPRQPRPEIRERVSLYCATCDTVTNGEVCKSCQTIIEMVPSPMILRRIARYLEDTAY